MSELTKPRRHVYELDYLRALAMTAVVSIHVTSLFNHNTSLNPLVGTMALLDELARGFSTPLFVLLSGAVLVQKWHGRFPLGAFYQARLERLLGPYLLMGALYLLPDVVSGRIGIGRALFELAFAGGGAHLWFIALIIQLYLLYPLLVRWEERQSLRGKLLFLAASAALQIAWGGLDRHLWFNPRIIALGGFELNLYSLVHRVFLSRYFYFVLGIMVGRHWQAITGFWRQHLSRYWAGWGLATLLLATALTLIRLRELGYMAGRGGFYALQPLLRLLEHLCGVGLLYEAVRRVPRQSLWARWALAINQLSFSIYLVHYGVLQGIVWLLARGGLRPSVLAFYPVTLALTLAATIGLVKALGYLPYSQYYVGVHQARAAVPRRLAESSGESR